MNVREDFLSIVSFGAMQQAVRVYKAAKEAGLSMGELSVIVEARREDKKKSEERSAKLSRALSRACPECGAPMLPRPVNNSPATITGDDSTFVYICPGCKYEAFTNKTIKELIESTGI